MIIPDNEKRRHEKYLDTYCSSSLTSNQANTQIMECGGYRLVIDWTHVDQLISNEHYVVFCISIYAAGQEEMQGNELICCFALSTQCAKVGC